MLNDVEVLQSNYQCIGNPVALPLPKSPISNSNGIDKDRIVNINTLNPFVTK